MDKKGKVVLDKQEENPLSKFLRRSKHYVCSFPSHALLNSSLAGGKNVGYSRGERIGV